MHTTTLTYTHDDNKNSNYNGPVKEVAFHYNTDFSGEVTIENEHAVFWIPGWMLKEFVGRQMQSDLISVIENMSGREMLVSIERMLA